MTLVLLLVGATAAGLGTRIAAVAFIAAAASAAMGGHLTTIATWTAATAAILAVTNRGGPRPLAVPAIGAAAVLAAGSTPNGAVVCGLWVVATAAVVMTGRDDARRRRWSVALCVLDLLLIAGVATTATSGFQGWPLTLGGSGTLALGLSATLRVLIAAGPEDDDQPAALLIVRTQAAVLIAFAVAGGADGAAEGAIAVGAVTFGIASLFRRRVQLDVVQELALFAVALGTAAAGWGPTGWAWGALAAGTLMHYLRVTVARGVFGPVSEALGRSAGIGLPFLPVVIAQLEGAARHRGWLGGVVALGLAAGLAGRSRAPQIVVRRAARRADDGRAAVAAALAIVAALWAAVLSTPRPPAGDPIPWPPPVAAVLVGGALVGGALIERVVTPGRRRRAPLGLPMALSERLGRLSADSVSLLGSMSAVHARIALGVVVAASAALWGVGWARGFL